MEFMFTMNQAQVVMYEAHARATYERALRDLDLTNYYFDVFDRKDKYLGGFRVADVDDILAVYVHNHEHLFAIGFIPAIGPVLVDSLSRKLYVVNCPAQMKERFDKVIQTGLGVLRPLVCTCGKHRR